MTLKHSPKRIRVKESKSAPWFQSGWSTGPWDSGNVCGEEAGTLNRAVVGSGCGTWADLHFRDLSLAFG